MSSFLIAIAAAWLAALSLTPSWHMEVDAFCVTAGLLSINAIYSLAWLTRKRQILIGLNCTQIILFGVLNSQLYCVFGTDHYRCDREPQFYDWIEFTAAHILRAADFLDALDEYGLPIQTITHNSAPAALILVFMHLSVDYFLLGLILRWASRPWQEPVRETRLEQGRREFGWLLATLALFIGFAAFQGLQASDWLLWPLDNLLRLVDVGDVLQLFGWQLHGVEPDYWTKGASILFRVVAGIWMTRLVILWRVAVIRTWGLSIDQLTTLLDDADASVRCGAAAGLGQSGPDARSAVPALVDALHDYDPAVRVEAASALGRIGPAARPGVHRLIDAVWLGRPELRLAAIAALARIGPAAHSAVSSLLWLLKISDEATCKAVTGAIAKIDPAALPSLQKSAPPAPVSKRNAAWQRSVEAARLRQEDEDSTRASIVILLDEGFFDQERDLESLHAILAARDYHVECERLFMPLFLLTTAGMLSRRKNDAGQWLYGLAAADMPMAAPSIIDVSAGDA